MPGIHTTVVGTPHANLRPQERDDAEGILNHWSYIKALAFKFAKYPE